MAGKAQKHLFGIPARDLEEIQRAAHAELESMRGSWVFLTGGTGFFGKWLLAALYEVRARTIVLSRDPAAFFRKHPEVEGIPSILVLKGHVADFADASSHQTKFVIHAAADTTAVTSNADEYERSQAIVRGTQNMLDHAARNGARLLNISSGAVYGAAAGKPDGAREENYDAALPLTPYARAKRQAETLCADSGVDFVTARAFAFLGPHLPLDAHFAAGNFLRDAMRGGPVQVRGDGTALRSYLYPTDLVVWLLRLLVRGEKGRAYNVGSDEAVSTAQLARLMADAVEPKAEVVIQAAQPQGPQNIYLPNIARARRELQLEVTVPLREAIARTREFHAT